MPATNKLLPLDLDIPHPIFKFPDVMKQLISLVFLLMAVLCNAATPVISNIRASQRPGTKLVDIYYDLADANGDLQLIQIAASSDGGLTYGLPCVTLSGQVGANVAPGSDRHIVWNVGADWDGNWVAECRVRLTAHDGSTPPAPAGMAYIPAGPFQMGDNFNELNPDTRPVRNVQVDAFFIDKTEVTRELWEQVKAWGNANGYDISGGAWKDLYHPVHSVSWLNAVKWCNARSEYEGLTPCYYTAEGRTTVYQTGIVSLQNGFVKWSANGYRLPTEAEWEKAARGGRTGQRYPWGNTFGTAKANHSYDGNPWHTGNQPWTSPAASYQANDFGLYGMAGNLREWTWDWYSDSYYGEAANLVNPHGPVTGSTCVHRGGSWTDDDLTHRVDYRIGGWTRGHVLTFVGFRSVRR